MRGASQQALIWVAMALPAAVARSASRRLPVPCVLAPSARVPVPVSSEKDALLGCGGDPSTGCSGAGASLGTSDTGSASSTTGLSVGVIGSSFASIASASLGRGGAESPFGSPFRSDANTSELQSLLRISYAVVCLNKKKHH